MWRELEAAPNASPPRGIRTFCSIKLIIRAAWQCFDFATKHGASASSTLFSLGVQGLEVQQKARRARDRSGKNEHGGTRVRQGPPLIGGIAGRIFAGQLCRGRF